MSSVLSAPQGAAFESLSYRQLRAFHVVLYTQVSFLKFDHQFGLNGRLVHASHVR